MNFSKIDYLKKGKTSENFSKSIQKGLSVFILDDCTGSPQCPSKLFMFVNKPYFFALPSERRAAKRSLVASTHGKFDVE